MSHPCPACQRASILDNRLLCQQCFAKLTAPQREVLRKRLAGTIEQFLAAELIIDRINQVLDTP